MLSWGTFTLSFYSCNNCDNPFNFVTEQSAKKETEASYYKPHDHMEYFLIEKFDTIKLFYKKQQLLRVVRNKWYNPSEAYDSFYGATEIGYAIDDQTFTVTGIKGFEQGGYNAFTKVDPIYIYKRSYLRYQDSGELEVHYRNGNYNGYGMGCFPSPTAYQEDLLKMDILLSKANFPVTDFPAPLPLFTASPYSYALRPVQDTLRIYNTYNRNDYEILTPYDDAPRFAYLRTIKRIKEDNRTRYLAQIKFEDQSSIQYIDLKEVQNVAYLMTPPLRFVTASTLHIRDPYDNAIIAKVPYGKQVTIKSILSHEVKYIDNKPGFWVYVIYKKTPDKTDWIYGKVFSGYLSVHQPPIRKKIMHKT
ncbi:hypothetical protein ACFSTE_05335 [Aquimarina hainanensis]|uniref:SH3 domain-containing protein n=1 Tax=Aquimarina hainanensis TaxID=1578017 RepID=A0ABW5N7X2_9FLAO